MCGREIAWFRVGVIVRCRIFSYVEIYVLCFIVCWMRLLSVVIGIVFVRSCVFCWVMVIISSRSIRSLVSVDFWV